MDTATTTEIREDDWRRMQHYAASLFGAGLCVCGLGGESGTEPVFEYVAAPDGLALLSSPHARPGGLLSDAFPPGEGNRVSSLLSEAMAGGTELPPTEVSHGGSRYSSVVSAPLSPGRAYVVFGIPRSSTSRPSSRGSPTTSWPRRSGYPRTP